MSDIEYRTPINLDEFKRYDQFRWKILRKPIGKSIESLNLAKKALNLNPKYVSKEYQKKQLWGKKLQKSAQLLFKNKEMKKVVKEALEKSQ